MTDETKLPSGLFGSPEELAELLANSPPRRQLTPQEYREQLQAFDRVIEAGVAALAAQEQNEEEEELEKLLRPVLEKKYAQFLLKRTPKPKTRKLYLAAFKQFQDWCVQPEHGKTCAFPARSITVAAFLNEEIQAGANPERIRMLAAAISYFHKFKEKPDPTADELVGAIVYSTTAAATEKKRTLNGSATHPQGHIHV
ncbi:MAG: hypothetical protein ACRD6I_20285 [Candidatus Acidiferrales bacterium]